MFGTFHIALTRSLTFPELPYFNTLSWKGRINNIITFFFVFYDNFRITHGLVLNKSCLNDQLGMKSQT